MLILGAGPTGICTLQCVRLKHPRRIIVCDKDPRRLSFVRDHYPEVLTVGPEQAAELVAAYSDHGGAGRVLGGGRGRRPPPHGLGAGPANATVTVVALYDGPQTLPLPEMYGKNLTFKTGGVDGCRLPAETLALIQSGKSWIPSCRVITHTYPLSRIAEAYDLFEHRRDGVIKVAVTAEG